VKNDEAETSADAANGKSVAKEEFDYTTKMIGANLSNFSAWHNRTELALRTLDEQKANDAERRRMLDDGW
jgi:geranylgeranyl transferase type-2 subunit alpha